jgi:hypothetical protein
VAVFRAAFDAVFVAGALAAVEALLAEFVGLAVAALAGLSGAAFGLAGVDAGGVLNSFTCLDSLDTCLESLLSFLVDFFLAIASDSSRR